MPYVRVRGVNLYYEEHGSGPTLVVLHGLLASVATAAASGLGAAELAAHGLRVITYDARGHGRSGYSTRAADYCWSALADDLVGLLDALGIEQTSLYGTSMGAGACLTFALCRPERVHRLVLRAPPPFEADLGPARLRLALVALLCKCFGTSLAARLLVPATGSPERERMRCILRDQRRAAVVPAIRGLLFDRRQLPAERMSEIQSPALILAHAGDVLHPLRSGQLLAERLRNAKLDVAPSVNHRRADADALTRRVADFIKHG
ncbi:MAG TPA: alpha/beta hydrolase [Polyangiaceae bacterium]|nr:alpha/beta hydrolase [Polyangiaceae bacterium]